MSKSHVQLIGDVSKALATLRKEIPETMHGFGAMAKSSLQDGALSELQKELIALAISAVILTGLLLLARDTEPARATPAVGSRLSRRRSRPSRLRPRPRPRTSRPR